MGDGPRRSQYFLAFVLIGQACGEVDINLFVQLQIILAQAGLTALGQHIMHTKANDEGCQKEAQKQH